MTAFIQRRLLLAIPTVFAVSAAVFLMLHLIPGDPASIYLGDNLATPERLEAIRHEMGLDRPIYIQYLDFVGRALQGDLGRSLQNGRPVALELSERLPRTAELAAAAFIVSVVFGVSLGILSALRHNTWVDTFGMLVALAGVSMPIFWTGLMGLTLFSYKWHIFPAGGSYTPFFTNPLEWAYDLSLPWITLSLLFSAQYARLTRAGMLETMNEDYVRTARAKGLPERKVVVKHGLRGALTPIVTIFGLDFGLLIGGAVLTEKVFSLNGLGKYAIDGIVSNDLPKVLGVTLLAAWFVIICNLIVDLAYAVVDPRVRTK